MIPLLALLLVRPSEAATPLLVSAFEAQDPASRAAARALEQVLARRLARNPAYETHRVEEVPRFPDYDARVYVRSCPSGEYVGCAQVLGERLGVPWALTGRVETSGTVSTVTFVVVDVQGAREVVAFPSEPFSDVDVELVDGLIQVFDSAVAGDYAEIDIRRAPESRELRENERAYARKELESIESEVRSVKDARGAQLAAQRALTAEDLAAQEHGEGQAPWERLGMKASTYLRYKNSGLSLSDWRAREAGRRGQVILRPSLGFARGPYATGYHGRYANEVETSASGPSFVVVDAQSVQYVRTRQGGVFGVFAGYGVLPWLDVGWHFAVTPSGVELDIDEVTLGEPDTVTPPASEPGMAWSTGPRLTAGFLPTAAVRPMVAAGLTRVAPTAASDVFDFTGLPLAPFEAPRLWGVDVEAGAEIRLGAHADLVVGLPVAILLGGAFEESRTEGPRREFQAFVPEVADGLSAGVRLGVQFRLGGPRVPRETVTEPMP